MVFEEESKFNIDNKLNISPSSKQRNSNDNNSFGASMLPVLPSNSNSRSKFSSWNNLNNELDETE